MRLLQFMSINTHSYTISALFIVFEQCKQRENQAVSDIYWSLLVIIWNCSLGFQSYNHNFPSEFDKLPIAHKHPNGTCLKKKWWGYE